MPSIQSVLACLMLAIVCVLAAMFACQHLCAAKPKSACDWGCHAGVALLFVLVFVHLCRCLTASDAVGAESFATTQAWGADPADSDALAPFEPEHARRTVGPDPASDELHEWQYHPQNTLVDYKVYEKSDGQPGATRLAPLADGSIGKRNAGDVHTGDVHFDGTSTRHPNAASSSAEYVTHSAASSAVPVTGTVEYTWPYDGQGSAGCGGK